MGLSYRLRKREYPNAEDLIVDYYRQLRNVENRLEGEYTEIRELDDEEVAENLSVV